MNLPLFRRFTYNLDAGHAENINIQCDWIKCIRTAAEDPRVDVEPINVSIDGGTASPFQVGYTINPPQPIKTSRIENPNDIPVQVIVVIGNGGVQDDGIVFSADAGLLPVQLPEDAQVRVDAAFSATNPITSRLDTAYHNDRPLKTTNTEVQRFEQRNPNQIIDRASGRVILPPRARSLNYTPRATGAEIERGAYNWHNGIRGDKVAVGWTPDQTKFNSFYTPEFIGQARVFGRNPTRKKLTIKAVQHGLLVSRVPFVLPRPQNQAVFSGGQIRYDNVDEYADAVMCVMGGFRPNTFQVFNPFSNNLGGANSGAPNIVIESLETNAIAYQCDIANTGGLVNGEVPPNVNNDINTGFSGYQGWAGRDRSAYTSDEAARADGFEAGDNDGATLLPLSPSITTGKGLYVNAGGTMWLQQGEEMVIEDHAPVYCLGCDNILSSSDTVINTLYTELSQFTWTEEFYAISSLTG